MKADDVKLWITYLTAAIIAVGSLFAGVYVWMTEPVEGRDLALVMGFLGTAFGLATGFLFNAETATRTSRATERALGMSPGAIASPPEHHFDPDSDADLVDPDRAMVARAQPVFPDEPRRG